MDLCKTSVVSHSTPKDIIIPMNGGKCVTVLKIGTKSNPLTPIAKIKLRSPFEVGSAASSGSSNLGRSTSPFIRKDMMVKGTTMHTMLGRMRFATMTGVVN